jgi:retron-type reverse transcriptase
MKKETWIIVGIVVAVSIASVVIYNKNKATATLGGKTQEEVDAEAIKNLVTAIDKAKK